MADDWARPVVHWEIEAVDVEAQRAFYADLFNWEIGGGPIMEIPAGIGGPEPGPGGHLRQSDRSGVTLYVQVRDLGASVAKATELGATVVVERFDRGQPADARPAVTSWFSRASRTASR